MLLRKATGFLSRIRYPIRTTMTGSCRKAASSASSPPFFSGQPSTQPCDLRFSAWRKDDNSCHLWFLYGPAAIVLGVNSSISFSEGVHDEGNNGNETGEDGLTGLHRIEDGSVISNLHTSKWRVFTDNGRDLFLQGKLKEAENYFLLALQEAKEGFGQREPHVASACNNLAELYRVKKEFGKAEPLYLEAINILEESFGPEDVRVGVAYHNLGQFYLVQRKLEEARIHYELALKIKGQVLGHGHSDYADTMYHLGTVLYLQGKEKDSEALIQESIRILEEAGQGESITCLRRLRYLSHILLKSNQLKEAETVQRKILQIMELSKGWNSLDTVIVAEGLALTLQSFGSLKEAWELLERCLEARQSILHQDHIQIGANMLHLARVAILKSKQLMKVDFSKATAELDKAKVLLENSMRIAQQVFNVSQKTRSKLQKSKEAGGIAKEEHAALSILLQSLNALGLLEINKQELEEDAGEKHHMIEAERAFCKCITAFKEASNLGISSSLTKSTEVKAEYLSCLKQLLSLISERTGYNSTKVSLQELEDEIRRVENEPSSSKKGHN